jgi:tetratricopeptide (TPR) repeat protein
VAYAGLAAERREALHTAAGRALETVYADRLDEAYGQLAYHYGNTSDAPRAVAYLARFAEKSARSFAHQEAVRALADATAHAERLPADERDRRVLELVLRQALSLFALGGFGAITGLLRRHQDRLDRVSDPRLAGHYYFVLAQSHSFLGAHDAAAQGAERAIAEAERCGDEATMGKAHCVLALEGPLTGCAVQGLEHGRKAVALLERTDDRWGLTQAHWLVGLNYLQIGEFQSALAAEARAQDLAEALGDPRLRSSIAWVKGIAYAAMGERDKGIAACRASLDAAPDPLNRAIATGWLGSAHVLTGDPEVAIPLLESSARQVAEFGFRQFHAWFTIFLAEANRATHRLDRALELARQGLDVSEQAEFLAGVGWAQQTLGRIAHARGDHAEAEVHLRKALDAFRSVRSRYELGRTHLDLAALAHSQRRPEAAVAHLGQAHELFRALGVSWYVGRTEALARDLGVPISG